jgi:RHS repeat-associated protein
MTTITIHPGSGTANGEKTYLLAYDANGNLSTRTDQANPSDVTRYGWDDRNRLTQVEAPGTSASYAYDALNRRIARSISGAGQAASQVGPGGNITTRYVYDGAQAVAEVTGAPGAGTVSQDPARTRLLITDALGSVLAQIKPDGSQAASYVYSPYGQTRVSVAGGELSLGGSNLNATEANASLYTAREYEGTNLGTVAPGANQNAQTASQGELYYYRARYYDPVLKRFISEDPIGLAGGMNTFGYVGGDPMSRTDASGLEPNTSRGYCNCDRITSAALNLLSAPGYGVNDDSGWDKFGPGTNKCNLFVCDALLEALGQCPKRRGGLGGPISAADWADTSKDIPGFQIVKDPRPGDIVAIKFDYRDASGHVGIVTGPNTSAYAAGGGATTSGWPWDKSKQPQGVPVFRRCVCGG